MKPEDTLFGEIAVALSLLTREQVVECLRDQGAHGKKLGEICLERGLLSEADVGLVLARQSEILLRRRQKQNAALKGAGSARRSPSDSARHARRARRISRALGTPRGAMPTAPPTPPSEPSAPAAEAGRAQSADEQSAAAQRSSHASATAAPHYESAAPEPAAPRTQPAAPQRRHLPPRRPTRSKHRAVSASAPALVAIGPPDDALTDLPVERPYVQSGQRPLIDAMLHEMVAQGSSDLHLTTGAVPLIRKDGKVTPLQERGPLDADEMAQLMFEIIPERAYREFRKDGDADFAYAIKGLARFRANYFFDQTGLGAVFRYIPFEILSPETIGLPRHVLELCWLTKGLVLVTGPTGSGKSTTLATLIDYINNNRDDHIITIEDPVEFVHQNKRCLVNQREVGKHTRSFSRALRAALREDPDIILVGELRDLETIAIAMETAETGHLVFGTLHTSTAPSTVDRIIDQFPAGQQAQIRTMLAGSLRGVIAQVLCRRIGGGRVAGYEVLIANNAVSNLIREGKTFQLPSIMQTGKKLGMQTLNDHLLELVRTKVVDPKEAYSKANDKTSFKTALERAGFNLKLDGDA